jgi:hypothetical protein
MRPRAFIGIALMICTFLATKAQCGPATAPTALVTPPKLRLQIAEGAFGSADIGDIEAVVSSAGYELMRFAGGDYPPIHIFRGGPIVLYRRLENNTVAMKLDFDGPYWCQLSYQFAHELCHITCGYRETVSQSNKWFEESICETASLFVLRRLNETWKTAAPYKNWRSYAPNFGKYADARIKESQLPEGKTLADWRKDNAAALEAKAEDRPRNNVVATALLPLFEAEPDHWAALRHLNDETPNHKETFQEYLQRWHDHTPAEHQPFVRKIAEKLGVTLKAAK